MCQNQCNCDEQKGLDLSLLDKFIADLEVKDQSSLIKTLHHAQGIYGYLPKEVQVYVANALNVSTSHVYGVVSFYAYFTDVPRGKHVVKVCIGTACYVKGAGHILDAIGKEIGIKAGETSEDLKFTLEGTRCIGACGLAPVFTVGEEVYGNTTVEEAVDIIKGYING